MGVYTRSLKNLERLPLQLRLLLFVAGPLVATLVFAVLLISTSTSQTAELQDNVKVLRLFIALDAAIQEFQKERSYTLTLYLDPINGRSPLLGRRTLLDQAILALRNNVSGFDPFSYESVDLPATYARFIANLAGLSLHRTQIDSQSVSSSIAVEYYSSLIRDGIYIAECLDSSFSASSKLQSDVLGYLSLIQLKEIFSEQRLALIPVFASQVVATSDRQYMATLIAKEAIFHEQFFAHAPSDLRLVYIYEISDSTTFALFATARDALVDTGSLSNLTVTDWQALSTGFIDAMLVITQTEAARLSALVNTLMGVSQSSTTTLATILACVIFAAIVIGVLVSFSISEPFKRSEVAMAAISVEVTEARKTAERATHSAEGIRDQVRKLEAEMEQRELNAQEHQDELPQMSFVVNEHAQDAQLALSGVIDILSGAPQQQQQEVQELLRYTAMLLKDVQSLVNNKIETLTIQLTSCSLEQIVTLVQKILQPELKRNSVQLDVALQRDHFIVTDKSHFYFLLQRLLINLIQSRGTKAIQVSAKQHGQEQVELNITCQTTTPEEMVELFDSSGTSRLLTLMEGEFAMRALKDKVIFTLTCAKQASQE
eukprot:TRINITY_DN715_c0_g1_i1.p1 TRINITY_DN715_c0_g1~~TRINITY_DN715_c0_g1_i1.p1  ORF type:complete len:601 (-),score=139.51 TRINITY_DN715_c0_g1_i1:60-1862(-)